MKPFEIKISREDIIQSEEHINNLFEESTSKLIELNYPETDALKWTQNSKFLKGIKNNDPELIAELLFEQNQFIKSYYEEDLPEPEPRAVVAAIGIAVVGAVTMGLALHVSVVTYTNRYMTTTTKVWGRSAISSWLDDATLSPIQKDISLAVHLTCSEKMKEDIAKAYRDRLIQFAEDLCSPKALTEI
ncbi:hypothetical protein ACR77M_22470 [Enterococcus avium]|jgi:hypothetical protein|uniref:hypothetical protein n=1 Tax=Enterococcus avium TaxID=33945 RepID=UPI003DA67A8C